MRAILQKTLPYDLRLKRALPGIQPLQRSDWLQIDEAYDQQIAERERLLSVARGVVVQLSETARPAAEELLDHTVEKHDQRYKNFWFVFLFRADKFCSLIFRTAVQISRQIKWRPS